MSKGKVFAALDSKLAGSQEGRKNISSSVFPNYTSSLGFTILGEIFVHVTVL